MQGSKWGILDIILRNMKYGKWRGDGAEEGGAKKVAPAPRPAVPPACL